MRSPSFLGINEEKVKFFLSDKILCPDLFVTGNRFLVRRVFFSANCNFCSKINFRLTPSPKHNSFVKF